VNIQYGLLGSPTNVITRRDGLIIQSDMAEQLEIVMRAHEAWLATPGDADAKATFAAALRRWGKAAGKQDAVEHAEKLLRGEL
jgi:hypothetical protein